MNEEALGLAHGDAYKGVWPMFLTVAIAEGGGRGAGGLLCESFPVSVDTTLRVLGPCASLGDTGSPDAREEKLTRAALKSCVERATSRDLVVILDSMNYIKGYRYELYCVSRAHSSSRCTVTRGGYVVALSVVAPAAVGVRMLLGWMCRVGCWVGRRCSWTLPRK